MPRFRSRLTIALAMTGVLAACSFGVDLDHLVGGTSEGPEAGLSDSNVPPPPPPADGGPDGSVLASVDLSQIASGSNFTCVRKSTGTVACWGRGTDGRLGDGLATSRSTPADVLDLDDAIDLAVGPNHACALRKSGAVYCWGLNDLRQLGNGTTNEGRTPTPVVGIAGALQISAGASFTCALLADKTVWCWGDNTQGQLGVGDTAAHTTPVAVQGLQDIAQIATTVTAACARTSMGDVYCWGDNDDGQSGSGDAGGPDLTTPRRIDSLSNVASLSVGSAADHWCAVMSTGDVKCWGYNDTGALGTGVPGDSATPTAVPSLADVASIATGAGFTLAVHKDGTVSGWGANNHRQLAIGETGPVTASLPVAAQGLSDITQVAGGLSHACALKGKREVVCWGSDVFGALGRKRPLVSSVPVKVDTTVDLEAIANGRLHACAVDSAKAVTCWGDNGGRQLGRSDVTVTGVPGPEIPTLGDVTKIAAGDLHSCALLGDGGVRCWGNGDNGTLGSGSSSSATTPVVFIAPQASVVAAGQFLTCALLKSSGSVACAGIANDGRLGSSGPSTSTPRLVQAPDDGGAGSPPAFQGATALAVGRYHACVLHNAGKSVACWGNNDSQQLGRGGGSSSSATEVPFTKTAVEIECGFRHTCVRTSTKETICWGRNANGQASGTDATSSATQRTVAFPDAHYTLDLALGDDHSCAVLDDHTVACWGAGALGQLGNGQTADANQPVLVSGLEGATAIAAEENHTCAITPTGTYCWGSDFTGQLGIAPVMVTGVPSGVEGL
jgi:alpha-tubulin suppressor-like RCC1 family protein